VKEDKQSYSAFAGIAQVLSRGAALSSTLNFQHSRGFLSDPYKRVLVGIDLGGGPVPTPVPDSRPDQRNQLAWLTRYRQHFSPVDATLHADYRFAVDDWQLSSHTFELAWYQGIFRLLRLVPSFRYYSQSQAEFYGPFFDLEPSSGHYSSDYRLSPFGALSWRLRAETRFSTWRVGWQAAFAWERYVSGADYALQKVSVENPGLVSWNLLSFTLTGRF
jgi:hypothetical protein